MITKSDSKQIAQNPHQSYLIQLKSYVVDMKRKQSLYAILGGFGSLVIIYMVTTHPGQDEVWTMQGESYCRAAEGGGVNVQSLSLCEEYGNDARINSLQ